MIVTSRSLFESLDEANARQFVVTSNCVQRGRQRGFTLMELLVAIFVFAIVTAIAMGGYNELAKQSEIVSAGAGRTRAVQAAVQRLTMDFSSLEPRPVREPLGDS